MRAVLVRWQKVVLASGAVLAAAGGVVYSAIPDATGVINACYDHKGTVQIVDSPASCKNGDTPISWNVQGRQGVAGPSGAAGAPGTPGTPGADGANGVSVQNLAFGPGEDANCPAGGSKFIAANGTTYACNAAASPDDGQMISRMVTITPGTEKTVLEVPGAFKIRYECATGAIPGDLTSIDGGVNVANMNPNSGMEYFFDRTRTADYTETPTEHDRLGPAPWTTLNRTMRSDGDYLPLQLAWDDGRVVTLWLSSARRFAGGTPPFQTLEKCYVQVMGIMK